ncbi:MAG TPA: subclass B1 metallo-beta-lactamase [Bacteroidota bacterium]|nr:subclass B1 metallo-beta-lactamase [Bacteroidota bacterium]
MMRYHFFRHRDSLYRRTRFLRRMAVTEWVAAIALLTIGFCVMCQAAHAGNSGAQTSWVGTWSTAPQLVEPHNNPPAPGLSNNTLRQIVRVSIGGDSLRIRFSNAYSPSPVTMHAVHIAIARGGSAIDTASEKVIYFDGKTDATIAPGAALASDPVSFPLKARTDVAITIYYGATPERITGHPGSRTTSYLMTGDAVSKRDFTGAVTTDHWYTINAIDVLASAPAACIAILGNSITDGRGSITNMQNRWPDIFSEALLNDPRTRHIGVLNLGIGGNCVLEGGLGPTALARYDRDILNQPGVRWAVVYEGVNDIGKVKSAQAAETTATMLIAAYRQMVVKAHAKNIRVYGATILPFKGNGYYNQYSESCRHVVNRWIRTKGNFDGVIDFEKTMRSPADSTALVSTYQNDGLHPDAAGYLHMGRSIDVNLFTGADTTFSHAQYQKISVSPDIEVIKISEHAYVHVSYTSLPQYGRVGSNGMILLNHGKAALFDTPMTDSLTAVLVRWIQDSLHAKITVFIPNHWHVDCMGGLATLQRMGVESYANDMTIRIARSKHLPLPRHGFKDSLTVLLGDAHIICRYLGPAHSMDNIVVWIPSEKILFAGCMAKELKSTNLGNTADGDVAKYPDTIAKVLHYYHDAAFVIPGHGEFGGIELLKHTLELSSKK